MGTNLILLAILGSSAVLGTEKIGAVLMHGFWQAFDDQHHLDFKRIVEENITSAEVHLIDAYNDIKMPPKESSITPLMVQVPA